MTKRQFYLAIITLVAVVGLFGYFSLEKAKVNANALVLEKQIEQEEKTERTKERGSIIGRLPFMRKKTK